MNKNPPVDLSNMKTVSDINTKFGEIVSKFPVSRSFDNSTLGKMKTNMHQYIADRNSNATMTTSSSPYDFIAKWENAGSNFAFSR